MLTHGALHRLAIDRPPVSRAFEVREPMARQTRICRYCLMMPMRDLCPLIMLVGSGAYVYHQIGNSPRKSATNEG